MSWKSLIKEFVQFVLVRCLSCTEGYDGIIYKQEFYDIKSACIAIKIELEDRDFIVKQQFPIQVTYKKNVVGDYYADLYIVDKIVIEIKAMNEITSIHKAQVLNYLKATGIKLGVLVNFSRERNTVDIERIPNLI